MISPTTRLKALALLAIAVLLVLGVIACVIMSRSREFQTTIGYAED